jgi:hypothetical protein
MSDATIPAVVPDAQQYDWRKDLAHIAACYSRTFREAPSEHVAHDNIAAYIESLEAEVKRSHDAILALTGRVERLEAERDMVAVIAADFAWASAGTPATPENWVDEAKRRLEREGSDE